MLFYFCLTLFISACIAQNMPLPWTQELKVTSPYMTGNNVLIAQTLLVRDYHVSSFKADGVYGPDSAAAVSQFQTGNGLKNTGILDSVTAQLLLDLCSADGYKDSGFSALSMGYLYKINIAVYQNRSIESIGTLFDENNIIIMTFPIRAHGHRDDGTSAPWPDMGDGDVGLNQFTGSGNTVTGLIEIDLNSPEPNPDLYGPWYLFFNQFLNIKLNIFNK